MAVFNPFKTSSRKAMSVLKSYAFPAGGIYEYGNGFVEVAQKGLVVRQ
jgi:hypothetical protein